MILKHRIKHYVNRLQQLLTTLKYLFVVLVCFCIATLLYEVRLSDFESHFSYFKPK